MYPPPFPLLITAFIYHDRNYHTHTYTHTHKQMSPKSPKCRGGKALDLIYFLLLAVVQTPGREASWSAYVCRGRVCPTKHLQSDNHACLNEVWRATGGCIFIVMNSENPSAELSVSHRMLLIAHSRKQNVSQIKDMM